MASATPPAGPASGTWTKNLAPDGRPFWSHSITKQSVWEKPRDLKTAAELEMEKTPWKEYESAGRPYWVDSRDNSTTWERPREIQGMCVCLKPPGSSSLFSCSSFAEILDRAA